MNKETFLVVYPLTMQYLAGPRSPQEVKKKGYAFTHDVSKAWPFPTIGKANGKARVIERHMSLQPLSCPVIAKEELPTRKRQGID